MRIEVFIWRFMSIGWVVKLQDWILVAVLGKLLVYPAVMSENKISGSLDSRGGGSPDFRRTHWSLVRRASGRGSQESREALEALCQTYWLPIYAFVRRQGISPHDAQD